jgi:capsular exopolysaccharide synthesis family protein
MNNLVPLPHELPARVGELPQPYAPERPELRKMWGVILQRAGLAVGVALALFAAVMVYGWTRPALYTAFGSMLVDPKHDNLAQTQRPVVGGPPDISAVETQAELLKSRALAENVVRRFQLDRDPEFNTTLHGHPGTGPADPATLAKVVDRVQSRTAVGRAGSTYVISVGFTSASPQKAAKLANGVMDTFLQQQLDAKLAAVKRANTELGASLESMRREAEDAEARVQEYKNAHGLFSAEGATMAEQEVSTLNQQIAAAKADSAEKSARLQAALAQVGRGGGGDDVGAALSSDTIRELRKRESETSSHLAQLQADFKPGYPEVKRTQAELDNIRGGIQKEINRILSSLRAEAQAAAQREASLLSSRGVAQGGLAADGEAQVGLLSLQQRADSAKEIYEAYLNRAKQVAAEGSLQDNSTSVSSPAFAPTKPSSPNKPLIALLAVLLGLIGGGASILLAELWGRTLRSGADVERELGVRFAGILPDYASVAGRGRMRGPAAPADYMINRPLSSFAEALRNLRAFLLYSASGARDGGKLIAVTSAVPREGKSLTSFCLARAMALGGSRVVVVDCDLRQRGLTRLIGDAKAGIVQVAEGSATLESTLVFDGRSGLWILPAAAGEIPYDLFTKDEMDKLFHTLGERFDYVVLDTPPILGVADARILCTKADRVLYAVHWNKTPLRTAQSAIDILNECGADVAGALLTRVDVKRQARFGYQDSSDYFHAYRKYYVTAA